jgi:hypothetical protein
MNTAMQDDEYIFSFRYCVVLHVTINVSTNGIGITNNGRLQGRGQASSTSDTEPFFYIILILGTYVEPPTICAVAAN